MNLCALQAQSPLVNEQRPWFAQFRVLFFYNGLNIFLHLNQLNKKFTLTCYPVSQNLFKWAPEDELQIKQNFHRKCGKLLCSSWGKTHETIYVLNS